MKNNIRIITSTNEDETYLDFWKLQYKSNKIFFPQIKLSIAFLTNRNENDELIVEMKNLGIDVKIYRPLNNVPQANLAKILRYLYSSEFEDDICIITDMDTIPLQSKYLNKIISEIELDKLLCVGREVLIHTEDSGKFPAHHTSGTGLIFKRLYNPNNFNYQECINYLSTINNVYHNRENIKNEPKDFSDESLNRALIKLHDVPCKHIERDCNPKLDWIDRSWWNVDLEKLYEGGYVETNLLRPYKQHYYEINKIEKYLDSLQK